MGEEPDANKNIKQNTEKETNIEQDAWRFVDLVFTGRYRTDKQSENLKDLAESLKNHKIALKYIDFDIKNLIYSAAIGNDKELNKILKQCYDSLETLDLLDKPDSKHNESTLPRYLKELKGLEIPGIEKLYNNVVNSYKRYYGIINREGDLVNINERLDDLDRRIEDNKIKAENNIRKELYPEFITLLGIFTAITFAIFGGTNLLNDLFKNIRSTNASLGQALILASILGFILWGIIDILFYWIHWISKIKQTKGKENTDYIKEDKIDKSEKFFNWIALGFLTITLIIGIKLFYN